MLSDEKTTERASCTPAAPTAAKKKPARFTSGLTVQQGFEIYLGLADSRLVYLELAYLDSAYLRSATSALRVPTDTSTRSL